MKKTLLAIMSAALLAACAPKQGPVTDVQTLASPSGNMEMTFHLTADGNIVLHIVHNVCKAVNGIH
mgnify:CR=1 FL=1